MSKKPFTPDNCPLQVGSVIFDPGTNSDYLVLGRSLDYDEGKDNDEKLFINIMNGDAYPSWYSGQALMHRGFEYYPNWPDTGETKPCYHEVEDRELVLDYLDNPDAPEASAYLKEICGIKTKYVLCQIDYRKSYNKDVYYEMTDEFYDWLDDKIQCEDCKNGCQIYKDKDGYYFCISGSGHDEVHIRIKEFDW